jgi:ABC-type glycerol-3-phosphate transport system permease component
MKLGFNEQKFSPGHRGCDLPGRGDYRRLHCADQPHQPKEGIRMKGQRRVETCTFIVLLLGLSVIILPFYLTVVSAFKTNAELYNGFFGLPQALYLENFRSSSAKRFLGRTGQLVQNNCHFTGGLRGAAAQAAYPSNVARGPAKGYRFLYYFMVAGILCRLLCV